MGKFSVVDVFEEQESQNERGAINNLFEVQGIAKIRGHDEDENMDPVAQPTVPKLAIAANTKWLAVSVESDVSIFTVDGFCRHQATIPDKDDTIVGLDWMGDTNLLATFTTDRRLVILSPDGVVSTMNLPAFEANGDKCQGTIKCVVHEDNCSVYVCDNAGNVVTVIYSHWIELSSSPPDEVQQVYRKVFSSQSVCLENSTSPLCPTDVRTSLSALGCVGHSATSASLLVGMGKTFEELYVHSKGSRFVTIHEVCDGRYLVGLTTEGDLVVYEMWGFYLHSIISLNIPKGYQVVDFGFIEAPVIDFNINQIVLLLDDGTNSEIHVKSLKSFETVFAIPVKRGTLLVPSFDTAVRVMFFAEPTEVSVVLKEIAEMNPETRYDRLIERNLLDEAEEFAKRYGLDCQKVFVSRMEMLFEEACRDPSKDVFDRFVKSMDSVEDHNRVAESCYSGTTTFHDYDRLVALFNYVEKKNVTDTECLERLQSLAYVFATFRMVVRPEYAPFDEWTDFVEAITTNNWLEMFHEYLQRGQIEEARVIWHRHNEHIRNAVNDEIMDQQCVPFLESIKLALGDRFDVWPDAIRFIEYDLMPQCLLHMDIGEVICHSLVDLLLDLAKKLEVFAPSGFPDNALQVTLTLERICKHLADVTVTPIQKAVLGMVGRFLYSNASRMKELSVYSKNLKTLKRLKEVYECQLSYAEFVSLDAERICYRILANAVKNPAQVRNLVTKFARPYMDEYRLDSDRTIYGYIESVSQEVVGLAVSASSPWNDKCLLVSDTIENYSLKCSAVTVIAKNARPPWNKKLHDVVQTILNNNHTDGALANELRKVCIRADLGEILIKYAVNYSLLDNIISKEIKFARLINNIIYSRDLFTEEKRLQDALKAVDLFSKLGGEPACLISEKLVLVSFALYLLKFSKIMKPLIAFLESLTSRGERLIHDVAMELIERLYNEINSPVAFSSQEFIDQRLRNIACFESVIQRFALSDKKTEKLHREVICIRKMQEVYYKWVTFDNLRDDEWKEDQLKLYAIDCDDVTAIYLFAKAMNMTKDTACILILDMAVERGEVLQIARILREATLSIREPSKLLMEQFLASIQAILSAISQVGLGSETEVLDSVIEIVYVMSPVSPQIVEFALEHEEMLEMAIQMHHYLRLFMMVIEQFVMDDEDMSGEDQRVRVVRDDRVSGMSRRVGVYAIANDGSLMAKLEAIPLMSAVAGSIFAGEDTNLETRQEWLNKWDDLCNFLALENQDILVYACRIFSAHLPCFNQPGESMFSLSDALRPSARNICERALQMHPCDLWTTGGILMTLPFSISEALMQELRTWVSKRRSPQTMLNYLRTVQFVVINHKVITFYETLKTQFTKYLWCKRLGKAGIQVGKKRNDIISDFAKNKLDPAIVIEYFGEYHSQTIDEQMLNYVIALVSLASSASDERDTAAFLQTATIAMKQCNLSAMKVFKRFRTALYTVSPYNYEPIYFILNQMNACVTSGKMADDGKIDTAECARFVSGCIDIYEFVIMMSRRAPVSKAEINWYMNHQKRLQQDKAQVSSDDLNTYTAQRHFGEMVQACFETGTAAQDSGRSNQDLLYQRDEVLVSALPEAAERILPMHLFLYADEEDIKRNVVPLIEAEVDIHTAMVWRTLSRCVTWLKSSTNALPRKLWLQNAVTKKVRDCVDKGLEFNETDKHVIFDLFANKCSTEDVVTCITYCASELPLSQAKVQLLDLGLKVGRKWYEEAESEGMKAEFAESAKRLNVLITKYKTELLLKKEGLGDALMADLVERPGDLIEFIYSKNVDWDNATDVERKAVLIEKLAELNGVDLPTLQTDLVYKWLPEGEHSNDGYIVDLNDTMGAAPQVMSDDGGSSDEDLKFPIFDASITKVEHLLNQLKGRNTEVLKRLTNTYLKTDSSSVSGGCKTVVRTACALLRTYTEEELGKWSPTKLGSFIEYSCYNRLLELAKEDMPMDTFTKNENKNLLVKALLAPTKRHTPQLCHLAACVVLDNEVVDKSIMEILLPKLCQARIQPVLVALLNFCGANKSLHSVKNLTLLWTRAYESSTTIEEPLDHVHQWLHFLLSCPIEGGRPFEAIRNTLVAQGLSAAATTIAIAANHTRKTPTITSTAISCKDPNFYWSNCDPSITPSFGICNEDEMDDTMEIC